ncbi:MAG: glycosyltransferase [Cyanobacteria bacterium J06631_9]
MVLGIDSAPTPNPTPEPTSNPTPEPTFAPTVSVIVPIYNGEQDIPRLLQALKAQTYPAGKAEYLLVDNGSTDKTPQLLADAIAHFTAAGLTLRVLNETDIQSSYAARNTGIRAASGDFLAFTDADCIPSADWLRALIQPFIDPQIGLVAGDIQALPGNSLLEKYAEYKETLSQKHTLAHPFCPYGQTANLGIRVSAIAQTGLFRPYLTTGGDADMCWRIIKEGKGPTGDQWQIKSAPDAIIQHRHRQTTKELYSQWYRYGKSNRYLHELHGVALTRSVNKKEQRRTLLKWLLKDLPNAAVIMLFQRRIAIDKLIGPVADVYCNRARDKGQKESTLPETARQKAPYPATPSTVSPQ